jgi:hypothetical protein
VLVIIGKFRVIKYNCRHIVTICATHRWEFIVSEKQTGQVILVRFIWRVSSKKTCTVILLALSTICSKLQRMGERRLLSGQTTGNHPTIGHNSRSRTEILTWVPPNTKQERKSSTEMFGEFVEVCSHSTLSGNVLKGLRNYQCNN